MTYHRWRRRMSLRLWCRYHPRRHSPRWGLPSSWRCPWWWRPVSVAGRLGRSAETLAWMVGWRRWTSIHLKAVVASIHLEAVVVATSEAALLQETLHTSSYVSFVHDFSSITPLFFDYMLNISVMENNGITLLKPRTKDTQDLA
jgi:hypothetical protein